VLKYQEPQIILMAIGYFMKIVPMFLYPILMLKAQAEKMMPIEWVYMRLVRVLEMIRI